MNWNTIGPFSLWRSLPDGRQGWDEANKKNIPIHLSLVEVISFEAQTSADEILIRPTTLSGQTNKNFISRPVRGYLALSPVPLET